MAIGSTTSFSAAVGYTTVPYTLYARALTYDAALYYSALTIKDDGSGDYVKIGNNGGSTRWMVEHYDGGTNWKSDQWTVNNTINQWFSIAGGITSNSNNRELAVNGVYTGTPSTTSNPVAWSTKTTQLSGTPGESLDHAIYNVKLTAADLRMLHLGISPLMVRTDVLERFWMSREAHSGTIQEVMQRGSATSGTPVYAANPSPVIYPTNPIIGMPQSQAPGGFPKINGITTYSSINGVTTFTSINGVT